MIIKPSLRFAIGLSLFHAIVAAALYVTAMPLMSRLALIFFVCLSLFYYLAHDALLLSSDSWRDIALDQGRVSVTLKNGSGLTGQVASKTFVSPYFILLCVKPDRCRFPVSGVIFPDALNADAFRDLCVRLKFSSQPI
jgi:toxin CptA